MKLNRERECDGALFIHRLAALRSRSVFGRPRTGAQRAPLLNYENQSSTVPLAEGMFVSRLPMTELTMRRLNRSAASPDVPAANLARHQAAGEHRRIPGIKFADQCGGRGLQCHPGLIRIVCRARVCFCFVFRRVFPATIPIAVAVERKIKLESTLCIILACFKKVHSHEMPFGAIRGALSKRMCVCTYVYVYIFTYMVKKFFVSFSLFARACSATVLFIVRLR